ncbi:MAG: aminotransferase class I/II-fold pyridoxal phosphate-dependent enzyme [Acidobacteria bacterium]|nr:aminotransferase class I/II-fold pyridoxal phosphate-dependent enzyme [Acidobacteriota bacterium]
MKSFVSKKAAHFTESIIREMTRLAARHGAVNLAQGFPDFPAPEQIKEAACQAILADINQYAITWGAKGLRDAIAGKYQEFWNLTLDPEKEITVCCGSTEAMIASCLALIDPGDEVVVFEPFYENYGPDVILSGAVPRFVPLHYPDWSFDPDRLAAAFGPRTRAVIVNTPNNPTGKVFSREELEFIAQLCQKWDALAITDEIYEHIIFDGRQHVLMCQLPGMRERTVTINGISKTYSLTGWRIGFAIAPEALSSAIRKVHDFLTVGAAAPLQEAAAIGLHLSKEYYRQLALDYQRRRDFLYQSLQSVGIESALPGGAYYIMCDIRPFGYPDDVQFVRNLTEVIGVAAVPGSSFFSDPAEGRSFVRFCFCKRDETLKLACERLRRLQVSEMPTPLVAVSAPPQRQATPAPGTAKAE